MEHLDAFAAVVEYKSINRASRSLNLSQPGLSRKIKSLEEALGVKLFDRRGKKLELTPAGQICYEYAVKAGELERNLLRAVGRFRTIEPPVSLTIGASLTTLQSTLPDLITNYTNEYPQTDIKAITGKTHEIVSMVQDKKADIGLVASRIDQPGLRCLPLFHDHLCLVLPSDHRLLDKTDLAMSDLNDLPMILFSRGTWYRILTDEIFHSFAVLPNVKMEIDSFEAILRLVATCRTPTLLPMSYLRRGLMETGDLAIRDIPELKAIRRTTSLIFPPEAESAPVTGPFIAKAMRYFAREQAD